MDNNRNIRKYNKELKGLRAILSDNEYTRTLTDGYHGFLADMHRKLIGNNTVTNKMLETINMASKYYDNYNKPETKAQRESMLVKITKLKVMLSQCGYTRQYEAEKMEFLVTSACMSIWFVSTIFSRSCIPKNAQAPTQTAPIKPIRFLIGIPTLVLSLNATTSSAAT